MCVYVYKYVYLFMYICMYTYPHTYVYISTDVLKLTEQNEDGLVGWFAGWQRSEPTCFYS